jgi:hypothetical protein
MSFATVSTTGALLLTASPSSPAFAAFHGRRPVRLLHQVMYGFASSDRHRTSLLRLSP